MPDLSLHVAGYRYEGWTSVQLTRGMDQLAHAFSFTFTDRWIKDQLPVEVGQACRVSYKGQDLFTGWIETLHLRYTADGQTITVSGRSLTGDLVDCAAEHAGGQWLSTGLLRIAEDLCDPFDIDVHTNVNLGSTFQKFELQDGETVHQALQRAAQRRGVLLQTRADGHLLFDRVGTSRVRTRLMYGNNLLEGAKQISWQDRFSLYKVKAQTAGNDNLFGTDAAALTRSSTDPGVDRHRPTIISAEDEDSGTELQKRADWERNVRAGQAARVEYSVQGWEHVDGLWEPNRLVTVDDEALRITDELLIAEVSLERSEAAGTVSRLVLTRPEAYDIQPLPAPKRKRGLLE